MRLTDIRIHDSEAVKPGIILDYDEQNTLVSREILRVAEQVPAAILTPVLIESAYQPFFFNP